MGKSFSWRGAAGVCVLFLLWGFEAFGGQKVVVLVSSYGGGHYAIARTVEATLRRADPSTVVVTKDVTDWFSSDWYRRIDKALFWYASYRWPEYVHGQVTAFLGTGNAVPSLLDLKPAYNMEAARQFFEREKPDSIVAAHYGSAQLLGNFRERGFLRQIPIAYVVSELVEGYTPRLAQRLDRVAIPDPSFAPLFLERGVPEKRLMVTGLPVSSYAREPLPESRADFLRNRDLDPAGTTIVIASGAEGLGDYEELVEDIVRRNSGPLNIIAVCGRSVKNQEKLEAYRVRLPPRARLRVTGLVENRELLDFIKASDVFVGKPGGALAAEVFTIGRVPVFLDILGNHEREIIDRLEALGYGIVCRRSREVGTDVHRALHDQPLRESILARQKQLREKTGPEGFENLGQFLLHGTSEYAVPKPRWEDAVVAFDALDANAPVSVELFVSLPVDGRSEGELAVRIDGTVYSASRPPSEVAQYFFAAPATTDAHDTWGLRFAEFDANRKAAALRVLENNPYAVPEALAALGMRTSASAVATWQAAYHATRVGPLTNKLPLVTSIPATPSKEGGERPVGLAGRKHPRRFFAALTVHKRVGVAPGVAQVLFENVDHSRPQRLVAPQDDVEFQKSQADARERLDERERQLFAKVNDLGELSARRLLLQQGRSEAFATALAASDAKYAPMQRLYDEYIEKKFDYFLASFARDAEYFGRWARERFDVGETLELQRIVGRVQYRHAQYRSLRSQYGQPRDVMRLWASRTLLREIRALFEELDRLATIRTWGASRRFGAMLYQYGVKIASTLHMAQGLLPALAWSVLDVMRSEAHQPRPGYTPASVKPVHTFFGAFGKHHGYRVQLEGRERIPETPKGTVNIVVVQHCDPHLDNVVLQALHLKSYALFGAADEFGLGRTVADALDRSRDFVVVGRGAGKPIDKAMKILRTGVTQTLVIYAEGSVAGGFFDTRPIRGKFATLVQQIVSEGFRVNVVPVAVPENFRTGSFTTDNDFDPHHRKLKGVVLPALAHETVTALLDGDSGKFVRFLRQLFLEEGHRSNAPAGSLQHRELAGRFSKAFKGKLRCSELLAASLAIEAPSGGPPFVSSF